MKPTSPAADRPMARAFVAFGANLGDPKASFVFACDALTTLPGTRLMARSSLYRTAPIGAEGEPDYLNAVVEVHTALPPLDLLRALLAIEATGGRVRTGQQAPRTLDLDLLLYGNECCNTAELILPHPRMHQRAFVLRPLAEIAPTITIPGQPPLSELLAATADQAIAQLPGTYF